MTHEHVRSCCQNSGCPPRKVGNAPIATFLTLLLASAVLLIQTMLLVPEWFALGRTDDLKGGSHMWEEFGMKTIILGLLVAAILATACSSISLNPNSIVTSSAIPAPSTTAQSLPSPIPTIFIPSMTPTFQATPTPTRPPTATPSPTVDLLSSPHLLSGMITGLDPGARVNLRLELLQPGDTLSLFTKVWPGLGEQEPGPGTPVARYSAMNGTWQAVDPTLKAGLYSLIPEADGYVSIPKSWVLVVPEAGAAWRYTVVDFKFLRPADAPAHLGIPLCVERPQWGGYYVIPPGTPSPTPTFAPPLPPGTLYPTPVWPAGTCYAGHFYSLAVPSSGLLGRVRGLGAGETAKITIYALPPSPGEYYALGPAFPPDSGIHYATGQGALATLPTVAPNAVLTATMTVGNGPWGLIDPNLSGHKYLVIAQGLGQTLSPASYETVLLAGKDIGLSFDLDFALGNAGSVFPLPSEAGIQRLTLEEAKQSAGFHLLEPQYLPGGLSLRWVTRWLYFFDLEYSPPSDRPGGQELLFIRERYTPAGVLLPERVPPPTPALDHPLETVRVRGTQAIVRRDYAPEPWYRPPPERIYRLYVEWSEKDFEFAIGGSLSLEELIKVAESLN